MQVQVERDAAHQQLLLGFGRIKKKNTKHSWIFPSNSFCSKRQHGLVKKERREKKRCAQIRVAEYGLKHASNYNRDLVNDWCV